MKHYERSEVWDEWEGEARNYRFVGGPLDGETTQTTIPGKEYHLHGSAVRVESTEGEYRFVGWPPAYFHWHTLAPCPTCGQSVATPQPLPPLPDS